MFFVAIRKMLSTKLLLNIIAILMAYEIYISVHIALYLRGGQLLSTNKLSASVSAFRAYALHNFSLSLRLFIYFI